MSQQVLSAFPSSLPIHPPETGSTAMEREALVRRFGVNSTSNVLLEGPKRYFQSPSVEGFIAYQISAGVAVIGGDPVCNPDEAARLIRDFLTSLKGRKVCAYQVSPEFLEAFRANGFSNIQIGKEAVFNLEKFSMAGGAMELVRAATNKARREGVIIFEHDPFAVGAEAVNAELHVISREWLKEKGSREMGFLLGGLSLDQRGGRRYFIARSGDGLGRIEGFIVCQPVYARGGFYLDVTRRRTDAVRGTMELLTTEIFRRLSAEGYKVASMGLAPLADLDDPCLAEHPRATSLMKYFFEHVGTVYDFKQLYRYKSKFHPHCWESRYLCFRPRLSPQLLYATLRVRDAFSLTGKLKGLRLISEFAGEESRKRFRSFQRWKEAVSFLAGMVSALLLLRP